MNQSQYKPEKGTEDLVAVSVTKKNGQVLPEPKIEYYSPAMWPLVSKLPGFEFTVEHDPRTADAKSQKVAASTVKSTTELSKSEQYVERYKVLFKSEIPAELYGNEDRIKGIVERAEAKLAALADDDAQVVNERLYEVPSSEPTIQFDTTQEITKAAEYVAPEPVVKAKAK